MNKFFAQVIGLNAGISVALAADRQGKLRELLERGILWIDAEPIGSAGTIGQFEIISNSPAGDYLEIITRNGFFASVLRSEVARWFLDQNPSSQIPLAKVGELQGQIQLRLAEIIHKFPQSEIRQARVERLASEVGNFVSFADSGEPIASSAKLVLATGARESLVSQLSDLRDEYCAFLSSEFLRGQENFDHVHGVHIIGVSHSMAALVLKLREQNPKAELEVWGRHLPALFYNSVAEAEASGYTFRMEDVCSDTGRVNRFSGIRPPYREVVRSAIAEGWLTFRQFSAIEELRGLSWLPHANKSIAVQALGYQANLIPLNGSDSHGGPLVTSRGHIAVDVKQRVYCNCGCGRTLPGAFGVGLGHMPTVPGPPRDGINTYVTEAAPLILQGFGL